MSNTSKQISYLLRHNPEDLSIDCNGYVNTNSLCEKVNISLFELYNIVSSDKKERFSFNCDKSLIRANQGHSINTVNIEYRKLSIDELPEYLYHGTSIDSYNKIKNSGYLKWKETSFT